MTTPVKRWAGGDELSIGELTRRVATLSAEIDKLGRTKYGTPEYERAKELDRERADFQMRLADAKKNARGPRTKANGGRS